MPRLAGKLVGAGSFYAAVIALVVFAAFPFYWMLITTFKADGDLYDLKSIPYWFNTAPTLEHIEYLFTETLFVQWLANSAMIGLCVVVITLLVALPAGYSLARMPGRTAETLGIGIFLTYLVPPTLLFLPLSRVVSQLGLQDSLWSLVVVYPTFTIPFCTWLLMGFFKSVPREIEEAAIVDGCTVLGAFVKTVLPLSLPAILTVVIFAFSLTMQEFVYALTFISDPAQKTMSVAVPTELIRGDAYFWGELMAASLLGSVPVALLYSFFMDYFVSGLTAGALKG
jgi:multiple sugar transport system permease protein